MDKFNPGFDPLEYNVIVLPDEVAKKSDGGIIIPEKAADEKHLATTRGTVVKKSPIAFTFDDFPEDAMPKIGERILMRRYSASAKEFTGTDGKKYWLVSDKDVIGVER